jgi:hypothetical protein
MEWLAEYKAASSSMESRSELLTKPFQDMSKIKKA